uniref:Uncharacterized protein n=1 Tax=Pararge aegeria TaxID=116150 RepID=S4Q010_9NEOP
MLFRYKTSIGRIFKQVFTFKPFCKLPNIICNVYLMSWFVVQHYTIFIHKIVCDKINMPILLTYKLYY